MNTGSAAPSSTWKVLTQSENTELGANNIPQKGYRISIVTGLNNTGSIWVPTTQYSNVEWLKLQLSALAAQLDAVSMLTHES